MSTDSNHSNHSSNLDPRVWQAIYRRTDSVVTREIAGETLIVPIVGELARLQEIYVVDEVAELIWSAIDGQRNLAEILELIVDQFEVTREEAGNDLLMFRDQLLKVQLISVIEAESSD